MNSVEGGEGMPNDSDSTAMLAEERDDCRLLPVVMATDEGYVLPTLVAADSLLSSKDACTTIQLYIIASRETERVMRNPLQRITARHDSPEPRFLPAVDAYDEASLQLPHITSATYYRLALPGMLPEVESCLYLDGDVIVMSDLWEAYCSLSPEDLVAGVRAPGFLDPEDACERHRLRLGLPALDTYINAGVLVMNLSLMRELNCANAFDELLGKSLECQDQDIINIVCYGRIRMLEPRYNVMTKYSPSWEESYDRVASLSKCYKREEWEDACANPCVVHYAGRVKPWCDSRMDSATLWWEKAFCTAKIVEELKSILLLVRRDADAFAAKERQLRDKVKDNQNLERAIKGLNRTISDAEVEMVQARRDLEVSEGRLRETTEALDRSRQEASQLGEELAAVYRSNSWKIGRTLTRPVRFLRRKLKKLFEGHGKE